MPISINSDQWESGSTFDWTAVHVREFLHGKDEAYTLDEIADALVEEQPHALPQSIREQPPLFKAYLFRVLERQSLRSLIEDRVVTTSEGETEIYYAYSDESGVFPIAEIQDTYPRRFSQIE